MEAVGISAQTAWQENKDTLPSQNTKPNSAVNCILSDLLLLIASYPTYCTGLKKEEAVTLAQISARHASDYSPKCFHVPDVLGVRDPQEYGASPRLPKDRNSGHTSLPQLPWPHWHGSTVRAHVKPILHNNLARKQRTTLQPGETLRQITMSEKS